MTGKAERIWQINEQAQPLPKAFIEWMDRNMPVYIMYEAGNKSGRCMGCNTESVYKKLKYGNEVRCPNCGKKGTAKTKRRLAGKKISRKFVYIQKIQNGIMARFIEREYLFLEEGGIEKSYDESLRAAVEKGKRQYWYEKRFQYPGQRWGENNVRWSVKTRNAPTMRIKGTDSGWRYHYEYLGEPKIYGKNRPGIIRDSRLRFFEDQAQELIHEINTIQKYRASISGFLDVYESLHRYPCLEALYKYGMKKVVEDYICDPQMKLNRKEHEPHKILGIRKELLRELRGKPELRQEYIQVCTDLQCITGDVSLILRAADSMNREYIRFLFRENQMPLRKTIRYFEKLDYTEKRIYEDYLEMAKNIGSDMTNDFVLFPRDLQSAHDAVIEAMRDARKKKEIERGKEKDRDIEKIYQKIKNKFSFESEEYILRPARSNTEIVLEGQIQHICVGNGRYTKKMIAEESYILFLRKKKEPDKPFYTVQISPDYEIIQRHGKYNIEGKEKESVDAFLDRFRKEVGHIAVSNAS